MCMVMPSNEVRGVRSTHWTTQAVLSTPISLPTIGNVLHNTHEDTEVIMLTNVMNGKTPLRNIINEPDGTCDTNLVNSSQFAYQYFLVFFIIILNTF